MLSPLSNSSHFIIDLIIYYVFTASGYSLIYTSSHIIITIVITSSISFLHECKIFKIVHTQSFEIDFTIFIFLYITLLVIKKLFSINLNNLIQFLRDPLRVNRFSF